MKSHIEHCCCGSWLMVYDPLGRLTYRVRVLQTVPDGPYVLDDLDSDMLDRVEVERINMILLEVT